MNGLLSTIEFLSEILKVYNIRNPVSGSNCSYSRLFLEYFKGYISSDYELLVSTPLKFAVIF